MANFQNIYLMHLYISLFIDVENQSYVNTKYQDQNSADYIEPQIPKQCRRDSLFFGILMYRWTTHEIWCVYQ
jgi:hypothetical protein